MQSLRLGSALWPGALGCTAGGCSGAWPVKASSSKCSITRTKTPHSFAKTEKTAFFWCFFGVLVMIRMVLLDWIQRSKGGWLQMFILFIGLIILVQLFVLSGHPNVQIVWSRVGRHRPCFIVSSFWRDVWLLSAKSCLENHQPTVSRLLPLLYTQPISTYKHDRMPQIPCQKYQTEMGTLLDEAQVVAWRRRSGFSFPSTSCSGDCFFFAKNRIHDIGTKLFARKLVFFFLLCGYRMF